jgi:DNA polymerase III sliding clamp (beta) subunit (PCNA family)
MKESNVKPGELAMLLIVGRKLGIVKDPNVPTSKISTLTGVEVTLSPDCVQMAATDGYRQSVRTLPIEGGPEKATVIVPARSLGELARISADAESRWI